MATAPSALGGGAANHRVTLSWTAGSTVDYHRIFRSMTSGVRGQLIEEQSGEEDAPGTSIVDGQLVNGTTYYYTVIAVSYDGHETSATAQVAATPQGPKDPLMLAQDENNGSTVIAGGAITISHTQAVQTMTPWVELSITGTFADVCGQVDPGVAFSGANVGAALANTQYPAVVNATGLVGGTTYYWRACVMQGVNDSYFVARGGVPDFVTVASPVASLVSPAAGAWTNNTTPALTARHTDADSDTGQLQIEVCATNAADPWSTNCGASYQAFTSGAGIATNGTAVWSPPLALPINTSCWRARSTDSCGLAGSWAARQTVRIDTPPPTLPTSLVITSTGAGSAQLTWTAATATAAAGDAVTFAWRFDPANSTSLGLHTETITIVAIANP